MPDDSRDDRAPGPPAEPADRAEQAGAAPREGRYVPPAPGAAPASARSLPLAFGGPPKGDALGQRESGRVTINFSGPPLELPGLALPGAARPTPASSTAAPSTATAAPSTGAAPSTAAAAPARPLAQTERPPSAPHVQPAAGDDDHDAWVTERKRRSTLPPVAGLGPTPSTSRPPSASGAALQHTWVSAHHAARRQDSGALPIDLPASGGDALALADRGRPSESQIDLMAEVRARYALDDLTGALQMAELVLGSDETNVEAKQFASSCRQRLEQLYTSQLGPLDAVPRVDVPDTDIRWLGLDHRAGFMLSRIDGLTSLDELLDLSGMERLEALKTVLSLVDAGAIRIPR